MGPHCSFCRTFTGPFSEVEGLFTVLICIPCLEVRQAQPNTLLGRGVPLQVPGAKEPPAAAVDRAAPLLPGLARVVEAEHPGWTATFELLRPYPHQRMRVVYRQVEDPPAT